MNKRKRQIIHAARQLFLEKGFNDTSIIDIISSANVSKGTFYNHFTSKVQCLIAILEEAREEIITARIEVALNTKPDDKNVLLKQIALVAYVHRRQNLIQIFEAIFKNNEPELKQVIETQLIREIEWLASRFVDVYGEQIRVYSYECAAQALAMIQHSFRIIAMVTKQLATPEDVVNNVLNHIEGMLAHLQKTKSVLITSDIFHALHEKAEETRVTSNMLVQQLEGFTEKLTSDDSENGVEYANYLLNEMRAHSMNFYVMEAILPVFNNTFKDTPHEAEANEISVSLWRYLQIKKQEKKSTM
ncbi:TetR/AcrR family transcriptional regulator [Lysinibacillus sp. SGAir0095]|uniref:TetR/AcrR family transcriptional regulator n=1 Tax=Lysinibacillus sp. SGAir0095 TaxID=2070463 RepID=UPI0010CD6383|nr:TetR/AcrR family transcriptional regulator [Lysinibacillus sp. SGAir0095]QCR33944.1 TetR/AcrR family transcriptional regulator [Lysinibacillus sp. SGAir0095]